MPEQSFNAFFEPAERSIEFNQALFGTYNVLRPNCTKDFEREIQKQSFRNAGTPVEDRFFQEYLDNFSAIDLNVAIEEDE